MITDYYLWHQEGLPDRSWQRQYINFEFLTHERRLVEDSLPFFHAAATTGGPSELPSTSLYTVPVDLAPAWKAEVQLQGCMEQGLSALYDTDSANAVGLFPSQVPAPYRLIRVEAAKRVLLRDRSGRLMNCVRVEDWHYLRPEEPYLARPVKVRSLLQHYQENLHLDDLVINALAAPPIGSPRVGIGGAGMTLTCMAGGMSGRVVRTFLEAMERVLPPEFRRSDAPETLRRGKWIDRLPGVRFHYASRAPRSVDEAFGIRLASRSDLGDALEHRRSARGECGFWGTFQAQESSLRREYKNHLSAFTETEATIPQSLSELLRGDVDLKPFWDGTTDEHWAAVVQAHALQPNLDPVGQPLGDALTRLRPFLEEALEYTALGATDRTRLATTLAENAAESFSRNVLSTARTHDRADATEADVREAVKNFRRSFNTYLENPEVQDAAIEVPRRRQDARVDSVENTLLGQRLLTATAIWEAVDHSLFKDLADLLGLLDWLHRKGRVIRDGQGRYRWL